MLYDLVVLCGVLLAMCAATRADWVRRAGTGPEAGQTREYWLNWDNGIGDKNWGDAQADCLRKGANLVNIQDQAEQNFVPSNGRIWIGCRNTAESYGGNKWKWVDDDSCCQPRDRACASESDYYSTNAGAVGSGVAGGVVVLACIAGLAMFYVLRKGSSTNNTNTIPTTSATARTSAKRTASRTRTSSTARSTGSKSRTASGSRSRSTSGGGGGGKARTASEPGTASGNGKGKGQKKGRATAPPVNAPSSNFVNPAYDGEDDGEHVEYSIVDASALRKTSSNQPVDADYGEVQYTAIDTNRNNRNSTSGGTLVDGNNHYDMAARANTLRQADIVYAMPGLEEALAGDVVYSSDAAAAAAAVVTYATAANDANAAS
eukprot:gene27616-8233_t